MGGACVNMCLCVFKLRDCYHCICTKRRFDQYLNHKPEKEIVLVCVKATCGIIIRGAE